MEKVCFKTKKGPAALGPYSTATIYGGVIYLSGMIGVNPQTGKAIEIAAKKVVKLVPAKALTDGLN